jgi:Tol biopolymer transport system component
MRRRNRCTGGRPRGWVWLLLAAVAVTVSPPPLSAQPFQLTQITNTVGGIFIRSLPSIDAAGTRIAFHSTRDLAPGSPGNADGSFEIFLFDATTGRFTQITSAGSTSVGSTMAAISADGTRIAFVSNGNLTPGSPGNPDGNREIFLFDTSTGRFTQITNTIGGSNISPSINANGTRIAFVSDRDLTPGSPGNADGNPEIFLFDTATGVFTQVTNSLLGNSGRPSIDGAGTRIAFECNRDLVPPGNADLSEELFLFDSGTGLITQITHTTFGVNPAPSISAGGTRIAFQSVGNLTPGNPGNPDGNLEIFVFDTTTGRFTQVTNTSNFTNNIAASINADGTRIAFRSTADLAPGQPGNADGNPEIFLFDTATGLFTQITNSTGASNNELGESNESPSINAAGTRIVFESNRDLVPNSPGNPDGGFEIFLAVQADGVGIPALSGWMQVAAAAVLLLAGLHVLRRRVRGRVSAG